MPHRHGTTADCPRWLQLLPHLTNALFAAALVAALCRAWLLR